MKFNKSSGVGGAWLDKKEIKNGDQLKLVSEAKEEIGQNGPQVVAKARVRGGSSEAKNVALNKPTVNALIEAFGDESTNWIGKVLTATVEKTVVGGKRGVALYLAPEGFEVVEDSGGFLVVQRIGSVAITQAASTGAEVEYPEEDINPEDIPF